MGKTILKKSKGKTVKIEKTIKNHYVVSKLGYENKLKYSVLYQLYSNKKIDFALYKALCLVTSYKINNSDIAFDDKIGYNQRVENLFNQFKLWVNKSKYILPCSITSYILDIIKTKCEI